MTRGIPKKLSFAVALLLVAAVARADLVRVVTYLHDGDYDRGIQFLTAHPDEIQALDAGVFDGWFRAAFEFTAYAGPGPGRVPVCRFFGAGMGRSVRHFYTAFEDECEALKAPTAGAWSYEGPAFYATLPDAHGNCPAGELPMHRGYRHRTLIIEDWWTGQPVGVVADGPQHWLAPMPAPHPSDWRAEGLGGVLGVAFCVPASQDTAAKFAALAATEWELHVAGAAAYFVDPTLRVSFGAMRNDPYDRSLTSDYGWLRLDRPAPYAAAVTGEWNGQPIYGYARWRPLDGKFAVEVFLPYGAMLYFEFTSPATIRGTIHLGLDCSTSACPRLALVGAAR